MVCIDRYGTVQPRNELPYLCQILAILDEFMLIHENHGLSISFIASVSSCHLGRKVCAAGFVFAAVTKLATCGHSTCMLYGIQTVSHQMCLSLPWNYSHWLGPMGLHITCCVTMGLHITCCVTMGLHITLLCYSMVLHITCCVTMVLHIILLCYYGPTYYFAVLLSACI